MFNVYFLYRRLTTALTLVLMNEYPYFQCVILLAMSIINLSYMWADKPLSSDNMIEIFNESTIYMTSLIMTNFLNVA
jgi:hypothetical protein